MLDLKSDIRLPAGKWSLSLPQQREVYDEYLIGRYSGSGESLIEEFLNEESLKADQSDELPPSTSVLRFLDVSRCGRTVTGSQAVVGQDQSLLRRPEGNTTEISPYVAPSQSRGIQKPTSPDSEHQSRAIWRPLGQVERKEREDKGGLSAAALGKALTDVRFHAMEDRPQISRLLVYIPHLCDKDISTLAATSFTSGEPESSYLASVLRRHLLKTAFKVDQEHVALHRFNPENHIPYLTMRPTRGVRNPTVIDRTTRLLEDGISGDEEEEARHKLRLDKRMPEFLWADAPRLDDTNDHGKRLQVTLTGSDYKWVTYAFSDHEAEARHGTALSLCDSGPSISAMLGYSVDTPEFIERYSKRSPERQRRSARNDFGRFRDHVYGNRHAKLAYTFFLTGAQLACIIPIHRYDIDQGDSNSSQKSLIAEVLELPFLKQLILGLNFLAHPTTTLFVFSALAFGSVAMHQYSINDRDHYQQLFLVPAIVVGLWMSLPPLVELGTQRVVSSTLALGITTALNASAISHWTYATCFAKKECEGCGVVDEGKVTGEVV
ncbi:hypothetical protein DE146DRAFT_629841 [Phaeosphaeria sp. MPI-PUGE-AT-0046c]|nr:hypothetical protein DE146DRAFT_629841 [Phaeosphaeria sp. MPI-PUGE-AT-0046c]